MSKKAENLLRENEAQKNLVLQYMPMVFYTVKATGKYRGTWVNKQILDISGFGPEHFIEDENFWSSRLHPEDREKILNEFKQIAKTNLLQCEYRWRIADGTYSWFQDTAMMTRDERGNPKQIIGTWLDISERKRSEEAINLQKKYLSLIFEGVTDFIVLFKVEKDNIYRTEMANKAFYENTGFTQKMFLGKEVHEILDEKTAALRKEKYIEAEATKHIIHFTIEQGTPKGTFIYDTSVIPLLDEKGLCTSILEVSHDLTEHERLQRQLNQAQRLEGIGRLAGGVAHDFNNLLTIIMSYAEMGLQNASKKDPNKDYFEEILSAGESASNLTRQLLTFSRRQIINKEPVQLNTIIKNMDKMLRRIIGDNVKLVEELDPQLAIINMDISQIEQILANLVVNAKDALPSGGTILVETKNIKISSKKRLIDPELKTGNYVLLKVTDNGIGMNDEIKSKIFDPFFTTKEQSKGTGLGLSTCYGIVKQNNGSITVESQVGEGTVFSILLPQMEYEKNSIIKENYLQTASLASGSETILVVEDNENLKNIALKILNNCGYKVFTASNGKEALKLVYENDNTNFDLVFTDVDMPELGGMELVQELKKSISGIKALFTSGFLDDTISGSDIMIDEKNFINKPYTPKALAEKIRLVLDS